MDSLACFQFGAIVNRKLPSGTHMHVLLLGTYPGVGNLGHQICLSLTFIDTAKQLTKNSSSKQFPVAVRESSRCPALKFYVSFSSSSCEFSISSIINIDICLIRQNG